MRRLDIPPTFVSVCRSFHTNNYARVRYNGELTEPFSMRTGVRQRRVLAPLLFNLFTAALTMLVDRKMTVGGIGMRYRTDGGLFNLRRLRALYKNPKTPSNNCKKFLMYTHARIRVDSYYYY